MLPFLLCKNLYKKKIYPYAKLSDLRLDLLPKIRMIARNNAPNGMHSWTAMDDEELLKSAGLYGYDIATGEKGLNLAAIMLLGRDDVILNVVPTYVTDALVRKVNMDRYDDREIIKTNLVESYELLLEFARKHLPDKFYLEDTMRKSLRNTIVREMVGNTLMHREFTSSYTAKFVIEEDKMYVENANRASKEGYITMDNLEPNPKNPIIASFFRNIGYADQLGSGVRNLFKYTRLYSGKDPEFKEGDIFKIVVPLDDAYSFDLGTGNQTKDVNGAKMAPEGAGKMLTGETDATENETGATKSATNIKKDETKPELSQDEKRILSVIRKDSRITQKKLHKATGISLGTIKRILPRLQEKGVLVRTGSRRSGQWKVQE